jgi:hypothetical protein
MKRDRAKIAAGRAPALAEAETAAAWAAGTTDQFVGKDSKRGTPRSRFRQLKIGLALGVRRLVCRPQDRSPVSALQVQSRCSSSKNSSSLLASNTSTVPDSYLSKGNNMEKDKTAYAVGDRIDKFCVTCNEERGHMVATLTKKGQISRVSCAKCGARSSFKPNRTGVVTRSQAKPSAPYDRTRTYRAGQHFTHPTFGSGEVTAVIEQQKIDVLFSDRVRRLIHSRAAAA